MAKTGFLPKEKIKDFLDALNKDAVAYVPVQEGDVVSFKPYTAEQRYASPDRQTRRPKRSFTPVRKATFL